MHNTTSSTYVESPEIARLLRHGTLYALGETVSYRLGPYPRYASASRSGTGPWRPCREAADKVLELFHPNCSRRVACWRNDVWVETATGQGLFSYGDEDQAEMARSRFFDAVLDYQKGIPPPHRAVAKRSLYHCAAVLRLLSAVPESAVLARENPALFLCAAATFDAAASDEIDAASVLAWLRRPQRELARHCGLPATESARKFLRRLPVAGLSVADIRCVSQALEYPPLRRPLLHARTIRPSLAAMLACRYLWDYLTADLINAILRLPPAQAEEHIRELRGDIWIVSESVRTGRTHPRRFRTFNQTCAAAWQASLQENRSPLAPFTLDQAFPPPPAPGNAELKPLLTPGQQIQEGELMRNCAGQQMKIQPVLAGLAYFYQLLTPERATIELSRARADEPWTVTEIRTRDNELPRSATIRAVVDALQIPAAPSWYPADPVWSAGPHPFTPSK